MAIISHDEINEHLRGDGKYWIAFTGDSITSCDSVHPNWREILIYVLQSEMTEYLKGEWKTPEWGIKGFNFAYDGATTKDIIEHVDDILMVKPDLVIGLMGANDYLFEINPEKHVENIQKIANKINQLKSKVVWSTSTPAGKGSKRNKEYEPYGQAFLKADLKNISKVDIYSLFQQTPTEKFFTFISEEIPIEGIKEGDSDLEHPNQLGNAYIAKYMLKEIFGIEFNPDKYIATTLSGEKYPDY